MIKTKLFGFFAAFLSISKTVLAVTNPDPSHIDVVDANNIMLILHGFDNQIPSNDTRNFQWIFDNYPNHGNTIIIN